MTTSARRVLVAAIAGVAVGALVTYLAGLRAPRAAPTPAPDPPVRPEVTGKPDKPTPRRRIIETRSDSLTFEQLQALGYVEGTYDANSELSDVIVYDEKKSHPGYNFYSSRNQAGAQLIDMRGREVHRWRARSKGSWHHALLLPNGDVLANVKDRRLSRYDKDSELVWSVTGRFHHDFAIHEDEIYALARTGRVVPYIHPHKQTLVDTIQVRSLDGELKREVSILDAVHDSPYGFLLPSVAHMKGRKDGKQLDVLHTNHIEVFDGRLADRNPLYARGNILISMRNINAIAIIDGETLRVVWLWGPTNVTFQHHPTLLDDGNILLFDNGSKHSRVIELDPESYRIAWQYAPRSGFFSKTRGSNQRLANGNTLITESDRGYVFEVTPRGEIVWKFANPVVRRKKKVREAIWRMTRIDPETLTFLPPLQ